MFYIIIIIFMFYMYFYFYFLYFSSCIDIISDLKRNLIVPEIVFMSCKAVDVVMLGV